MDNNGQDNGGLDQNPQGAMPPNPGVVQPQAPTAPTQPPVENNQPLGAPAGPVPAPNPVEPQPVQQDSSPVQPTSAPAPAPAPGVMPGGEAPANPVMGAPGPQPNAPGPNPVNGPVGPGQPMPTQPVTPDPLGGKKGKFSLNPKALIAGVAGLVVILILVIVAVVFLGGSGSIAVSDLVDDSTDSGISFKRPQQWVLNTSADSAAYDAVYTLEGVDFGDADQGMIVASQPLGVDFNSLNSAQKEQFESIVTEGFSDKETFDSPGCEEVGELNNVRANREEYILSYIVSATCLDFEGTGKSAVIEMFIGIAGSDMHMVVVTAFEEVWDNSADAFEAIINSVRPE